MIPWTMLVSFLILTVSRSGSTTMTRVFHGRMRSFEVAARSCGGLSSSGGEAADIFAQDDLFVYLLWDLLLRESSEESW